MFLIEASQPQEVGLWTKGLTQKHKTYQRNTNDRASEACFPGLYSLAFAACFPTTIPYI